MTPDYRLLAQSLVAEIRARDKKGFNYSFEHAVTSVATELAKAYDDGKADVRKQGHREAFSDIDK